MIIERLNTLVSSPPLFFALYLTLVNTFLAVTHGPLDPEMRYSAAETYMNVVSIFMFSMFMQVRPQALPLIQAIAKLSFPPEEQQQRTVQNIVVEDCSSCSD